MLQFAGRFSAGFIAEFRVFAKFGNPFTSQRVFKNALRGAVGLDKIALLGDFVQISTVLPILAAARIGLLSKFARRAISTLAAAFVRRWACAGDRLRWAQSRFAPSRAHSRARTNSALSVRRFALNSLGSRAVARAPPSLPALARRQKPRHYRAKIARRSVTSSADFAHRASAGDRSRWAQSLRSFARSFVRAIQV